MTSDKETAGRLRRLVSQFVDGELSPDEIKELSDLVRSDVHRGETLVDDVLLDSLLREEISTQLLQVPVALGLQQPTPATLPATTLPLNRLEPPVRFSHRLWKPLASLVAATVLVTVAFLCGRWEKLVFADATSIVRAAMAIHAEPIERVYVVTIERDPMPIAESAASRDARVVVQADRFYVEMNRDANHWAWGRDLNGAIWLTLGKDKALRIESDEIGPALQHISDIYSLNLESLLDDVLRDCDLKYSETPGRNHLIAAKSRPHSNCSLREATIEVDRETKTIRRLVINRELPSRGMLRTIFTLVDARSADESKYCAEGHLLEPRQMLTRAMEPDRRCQLLISRFGPSAGRWIETKSVDSGAK